MNSKIKKLTYISILVGLLSVISPIGISIGVVPFTFTLLIIFIISSILNLKNSIIVISIYILIGILGLPIFSLYRTIYDTLSNGTIGFIVGYIPCVIVTNMIININKHSIVNYLLGMFFGLFICYTFGVIIYILIFKTSLLYTLTILIFPFVIFDIIKIIIASITGFYLNKIIKLGSL